MYVCLCASLYKIKIFLADIVKKLVLYINFRKDPPAIIICFYGFYDK